jgi:hypothetical protein
VKSVRKVLIARLLAVPFCLLDTEGHRETEVTEEQPGQLILQEFFSAPLPIKRNLLIGKKFHSFPNDRDNPQEFVCFCQYLLTDNANLSITAMA